MKKALSIITAACLAGAMLSGCSGKDKNTYIDIDSDYKVKDSALTEKLEMAATPLNTVITDYKQDTMKRSNSGVTFDDKYCYLFTPLGYWGDQFSEQALQSYTINLQTGEMVSMCDSPGCTHDINLYPNCINHKNFNNATAVGDAIWYIGWDTPNKITEKKGDTETVIFENTYCTEFEENVYQETPTDKYVISRFLVDDDYIYLIGPSYTYRIDRKTMKAEEPINISDDAGISTPQFYDGKAYVFDDLQELFVFDYDSREVTKIADKIEGFSIYNDKLYTIRETTDLERPEYDDYKVGNDEVWSIDVDAYIAANEEYNDSIVSTLYRMDMDFTNEEKLLDGCAFYEIIDNKIYYHGGTSKDRGILKCYDIETGEDKVIYDDWADAGWIVTAEHIDRIFVIGYEFVAGHENDEYKVSTNTGYLNSKIISFRSDGSDFWTVTVDGNDTIT